VYTLASTLLSWVALWALGFVRASVRGRNGGCGSGSSSTVQTKSYWDTNAEYLDPTATETQGDPSKGVEDEETARMFKLECQQKELDQCSINMKRLIARNTFKTKTGSYKGFSEQYVQEVLK
jgi:hypothetical protein